MEGHQGAGQKYIKQIRLQGKKEYFPNKYYSPFEFLDKFNEAIKKHYDLRVIELKYVVSKSKHMKDIDDHFSSGNFAIEKGYNNIYDIENPFMKDVLKDTIQLVPPKDFDYNKLEQENEAAKRKDEERKLDEIHDALELLNNLSLKKDQKYQLRSISHFKMKLEQSLKESQVEVFIKAVMNKAIEDRLQMQKNSSNPVVVKSTGKHEIRVYLHPVKADQENADLLVKMSPISDWSLCSFYPKGANVTNKSQGVTYWSLQQVISQANKSNNSIKTESYISLHRNKKGIADSLVFYAFMFNQIVIKAVVNLAQIKKVQFLKNHKRQFFNENCQVSEYYLHLTYPPRYYISIYKPDLACDDGFIRSWQRVQNFMFLRNDQIMNDQFFRLYLFSNTIFRIKITKTEGEPNGRLTESEDLLARIIQNYHGTVECTPLKTPYDLSKKVSSLNTIFQYKNFLKKLSISFAMDEKRDKIWKLKYLMLVLVRYNAITPSQIQKITTHIEQRQNDLDIYIYILWQSVALVASTNYIENQYESYLHYLESQYEQIKKLSIHDIISKVSKNTDSIAYIFRAILTPSGYLYSPPTPEMKGRLMKQYCKHSEHFLRVNIGDDSQGTLKNQKYITKSALKNYMQKIRVVDRQYKPLGWSPSQLRSYSLWYIHEYNAPNGRLSRQQVLSFLGSFDKITNPAKKAARIGQAFSASWTYLCKDNEIKEKEIEDDYSNKGYMFTDGIGKISHSLIEKISLKLSIRELSIIQIRYKGAKGILVMDPKLQKNTIHLRKSMIKYDCNHESARKFLDILDWNKYKAGFLNRQTIILLRSLGIEDKVFQKRQNQHIGRISNLSFKDCSIFKHMNQDLNTDISNLEPANVTILHLLRAGFKLEEEPFFRGVLQTMKKNGYHQLKIKSNIMIQKSARIIGIIDQYDILNEGELYCSIFDNLVLKPRREHVEGDVIVTRNPCLHPADIRKMTCISQAQTQKRFKQKHMENIFQGFVNCVIFPKKGQIPVTAQISGSDLDGDNFFICWDRELIPKEIQQIYVIDTPIQKKQTKIDQPLKPIEQQYKDMIHFFVEYLNYEKLGQIDNSHLVKADKSPNYAKDKDCIELAKIHGKAVDFPKTGFCPQVDPKLLVTTYPDFMQKEESPDYPSTSILGRLYRDIKERIQNLLKDCEASKAAGKIDQEVIRDLTSELRQSRTNKQIAFEQDQIKQTLQIVLDYERELEGLIALVGVDTEYQIYSGNFTIAKEKVKIFGKNRLIAAILGLRSRYFQMFFGSSHLSQDKIRYHEMKEKDLQNPECFSPHARKRALLFYLCSYIIKFYLDQEFLNDDTFGYLRQQIIGIYKSLTHRVEGKFCGFVWFVVPKIMINQKHRVRRDKHQVQYMNEIEEKPEEKKQAAQENEEQVI